MGLVIFGVLTQAPVFAAQPDAAATTATATTSAADQGAARRWAFDRWNDPQGWTASPELGGRVLGGAMWLTVQSGKPGPDANTWGRQMYATTTPLTLDSPAGLGLPANKVRKVRLRLLNLSPETDGFVFWRLAGSPAGQFTGPVRFTMQPDLKQWQEVTAHLDDAWAKLPEGAMIDQIRLAPAQMKWRGDMWIASIEIADGPPRPAPVRPDVVSDRVVPRLQLPGVTQADFQDAFKVLDECLCLNTPVFGFPYPVMAPGGAYGENWWQLDSGLNVAGAKWVNQAFVEGVIRGFIAVQGQNPDGRIDLWGGSACRGEVGDVSSLPRYFEVAWDVARRTTDGALREQIYQSMRAYLEWWLSPVKRDPKSGLITAVAEETFGEPRVEHQATAPIDLNVAVAVGCANTAALAAALGKDEEGQRYREALDQLKAALNQYCWNEQKGFFYNYYVKDGKQGDRLIVSSLDALRLGLAQPERAVRMIEGMRNPKLFNWGVRPLTSIAMNEPAYVEATGFYDGRAWLGDIWTLRNLAVMAGLADCGRHDLAAELAWATVREFNHNTTEYVVPGTGRGEGQPRYGWSASQYVQTIVEYIFGVDCDRLARRIQIFPRVPRELLGQELKLSGLIIPGGAGDGDTRLDLTLRLTAPDRGEITATISGPLPAGQIEIMLPASAGASPKVSGGQGQSLPVTRDFTNNLGAAIPGVAGVRLPAAPDIKLRFE